MNTTLSIAFLSGLISFLSPCVLPLIPGYISYISGISFDKIKEKKRNLIAIKTIFFTLGFSSVFIALGSSATFIGQFFLLNSNIFRIVAGIVLIIFSLQLIGIINFNFMNKDIRVFTNQYNDSLFFPLVVGAAFGAWIGIRVCINMENSQIRKMLMQGPELRQRNRAVAAHRDRDGARAHNHGDGPLDPFKGFINDAGGNIDITAIDNV